MNTAALKERRDKLAKINGAEIGARAAEVIVLIDEIIAHRERAELPQAFVDTTSLDFAHRIEAELDTRVFSHPAQRTSAIQVLLIEYANRVRK